MIVMHTTIDPAESLPCLRMVLNCYYPGSPARIAGLYKRTVTGYHLHLEYILQ